MENNSLITYNKNYTSIKTNIIPGILYTYVIVILVNIAVIIFVVIFVGILFFYTKKNNNKSTYIYNSSYSYYKNH